MEETPPINTARAEATKPSPGDYVPGTSVTEVLKERRGHPLQCEVTCQRRFAKKVEFDLRSEDTFRLVFNWGGGRGARGSS